MCELSLKHWGPITCHSVCLPHCRNGQFYIEENVRKAAFDELDVSLLLDRTNEDLDKCTRLQISVESVTTRQINSESCRMRDRDAEVVVQRWPFLPKCSKNEDNSETKRAHSRQIWEDKRTKATHETRARCLGCGALNLTHGSNQVVEDG